MQAHSTNIDEEPEFVKCDLCRCPTHIFVAKWVEVEGEQKLICKHCQNIWIQQPN
jgi:hypothetical protein